MTLYKNIYTACSALLHLGGLCFVLNIGVILVRDNGSYHVIQGI